jgi:mannonate dehydratase
MALRISMGHVDTYDARTAEFARQLGLRSVHLHAPSNLPADAGYWRTEDLRTLRETCENDGLALEGLENVPVTHFEKIVRGDPGRDEQLENYCSTIRNMAAAGIYLLGYHFMCTYVWRTSMGALGRGGARVSAFDLAEVDNGNALAAYKLTPSAAPQPIDEAKLWANHQYFLDAVLPTAERTGVRLALHPDDPPTDVPLGNAARIFTSPANLARGLDQAHGSHVWGLNLCLGSVSEMGGQAAVDEVIDRFGSAGRIWYVHFRDVRGQVPAFAECFLGEGNLDPPAVIRRLNTAGFDGFLIDDHVPAMVGDANTWGDTSSDTYCSRGRAHAIGYLQGLLDALDLA